MKVGDVVKISDAGRQDFPNSISNPHNKKGTIINQSSTRVRVLWENGVENTYKHYQITSWFRVKKVCDFIKKFEQFGKQLQGEEQ